MERVVTIDAAGRVVVPKDVRDRLALVAGHRLLLTDDGGRLVLQPIPEAPRLVVVDGVLVVADPLLGELPDHRSLRDERSDRQWSGS